ncbi:unnamed protein product [Prunus brigantina]
MARAVASEAQLTFLAVEGPELLSKWVGESEKAVKSLFAKATTNAPAIIFLDEIDSLSAIRQGLASDRVTSQLFFELEDLHARDDVIVIAATRRPDKHSQHKQVFKPWKVETFEEDGILVLEFGETLPIGPGVLVHMSIRMRRKLWPLHSLNRLMPGGAFHAGMNLLGRLHSRLDWMMFHLN